ncbi:hypothetical protein JQC91_16260 [Jannaschia sp. Os4]|uniref:hypothetical protein n=1 Tax=Jannaschia sp. Os4 TaxID=2807617 RepID=UPI00193A3587|nr:hypothetical protein [Jannaschia sp. Os4]MBM2577862.1 hypothetical protein [Jannaschia sp. Os4]
MYVPLAVTLATAVAGLAATLFTQYQTKKREREASYRARKVEVYTDFLRIVETLLNQTKAQLSDPNFDEKKLHLDFATVRSKAVLWASPSVLKEFSEFTKLGPGNPFAAVEVLERIQRAMREDLGLSNGGLDQGFFVHLLLNRDGSRDYASIVKKRE